jgi:hypothetical protein
MPRSSQWSLTFGPPNQNPVNTTPLRHACHMSRQPHPPWFNHPNNIRWRMQAMKFIIMKFSSLSVFFPLRSRLVTCLYRVNINGENTREKMNTKEYVIGRSEKENADGWHRMLFVV